MAAMHADSLGARLVRKYLCPNVDLSTVAVAKGTGEDQYHVDQPPDPESADREELNEAGADFADVETMRAEDADEEAEQGRGQNALFRVHHRARELQSAAVLHDAAIDAHHGLGVHGPTAGAAERGRATWDRDGHDMSLTMRVR